jgi:hypothetical protein
MTATPTPELMAQAVASVARQAGDAADERAAKYAAARLRMEARRAHARLEMLSLELRQLADLLGAADKAKALSVAQGLDKYEGWLGALGGRS